MFDRWNNDIMVSIKRGGLISHNEGLYGGKTLVMSTTISHRAQEHNMIS